MLSIPVTAAAVVIYVPATPWPTHRRHNVDIVILYSILHQTWDFNSFQSFLMDYEIVVAALLQWCGEIFFQHWIAPVCRVHSINFVPTSNFICIYVSSCSNVSSRAYIRFILCIRFTLRISSILCISSILKISWNYEHTHESQKVNENDH